MSMLKTQNLEGAQNEVFETGRDMIKRMAADGIYVDDPEVA